MSNQSTLSFGVPQPEQHEELNRLLTAALHIPAPNMVSWVEGLGQENMRLVQRDQRVVAGLGLIHMGQWFGGRRVPMAGVTAVGVAPDQRGGGVGSVLMRGMLEELHGQGVALSALYPATLSFYRKFDYLRAGYRLTYELPLATIDVDERAGELVPITPEHYPDLRRLYEERARQSAGNLHRPEWMWQARLEPKDSPAFRFLVVNEGRLEGYVVFTQGARSEPLQVADLCALTPTAGRRLLTLFAGYRTMVEHVVWSGGTHDPLLYMLGENMIGGSRAKARITRPLEWMLRIVDVEAALNERGYPAGLNAELHLDLHDPLLPGNNGRWVLRVADGRGSVEAGGAGRVELGVAELAAIYSSFMAPSELRAIGAIRGSDEDLALMGALFSGPQPWIGDMF
ncbi:MAG TPA: GNAT family N-acetyltransferase [Herpetosiphonaceae bacterium]